MKSIKDLTRMFSNISSTVKDLGDLKNIEKDLEKDVLKNCNSEQKKEFFEVKKQAKEVGEKGDYLQVVDLQRKFNKKRNGSNTTL